MDEAGFWELAALYGLMIGLPCAFIAAGAWLLYGAHKFMQRSVRVTGTVEAVHQSTSLSRSSDGRTRYVTTYRPVFRYTDGRGRERRAETFLAATGYNFPVGSQHEILVDREEPGKARMPGAMIYGFGAIFLAGGLLFGTVGLIALRTM